MALICDDCGHYVGGADTCPRCGWSDASVVGADEWRGFTSTTDPHEPGLPEPDFPEPDFPGPDPADAPRIAAPFGPLRGTIVDGGTTRTAAAGGVVAVRVLLLGLVGVSLIVKGPRLIDLAVQGLLSALLAFLVPIILIVAVIALLGRFMPVGGCLTVLLQFGMLGAARRGASPDEPDGWDVLVETPHGVASARIAAAIPLDGGEEVVLHGPTIGGTKHAWIVMGLHPRTFTRVGRGVVGVIFGAILVVPACVALLVAV